jgi:hypothetical protein
MKKFVKINQELWKEIEVEKRCGEVHRASC